MAPRLDIHLLGGFRLFSDGQLLDGFNSARLQSLLAYLVLRRDGPQSRQRLALLFWPDTSEDQARTNTRKSIHFLRQALPDPAVFLSDDRTALQWRRDAPFSLDVAEFEAAVAAGDYERAAGLYPGDLLPECYDDWVVDDRERLRQTYLGVLERLIRQKEDARDYAAALNFAQELLKCDPLREELHRHVIRVYALKGDRAAALHAYQECAALLQRELGIAPGPVTRQVYESLLRNKENSEQLLPMAGTFPLIGRQLEWLRLQETWQRAAQGNPQLALIYGEAGIGKTRLAEELLVWVDRQALPVASAACYAAEGASAYAPVTTWLRGRSLSHLEPGWRSEVARLLPGIADEAPGAVYPGPLTQPWQIQRFHEALARAILGIDLAEGQPILLLLEDLQWCDGDTLAWLNYLLRYHIRARLLLVCTLRTEDAPEDGPLPALLTDLRRHKLLTEISLQPLDSLGTTRLGEAALGQALDGEAAASLYRETEGNPLFIVEFVRAGLTHAAATVDEGTAGLPPLVKAAVVSRLARLSQPARRVMHLAAVIGREFNFDVLQRAMQWDEETLFDALDELWQRNVIREKGKDAYDFSHDKLRQVAYDQLGTARKRSLHKRVAESLSDAYAQHPGPVSGQIGWHYEQAGNDQAAAEWLWKAGDRSAEIGAYIEAVSYLKRALALLPMNDPRRAELLCHIGKESAIPYGGARELEFLQQGLDFAQRTGDRSIIARASLSMSQAMSMRGQNLEATCLAQAALAHAEAVGDQQTLGRALVSLGALAYYRREYAQAMQCLEKGLAIFQSLDDGLVQDISDSMLRALNYLGLACLGHGDFEAAARHWRRVLDLCEQSGNRPFQAMATTNLAWMAFIRGDYDDAEPRQFEALRLYRELGDHGGLAVANNTLGHIALHREQLDRAQDYYRIGLKEATYFYTTPVALETLAGLAGLWARSGKVVQAAELLGLAISHPHTSPEVAQVAPYVRHLLEELMDSVDLAAALQRGKQLDLEQTVKEISCELAGSAIGERDKSR